MLVMDDVLLLFSKLNFKLLLMESMDKEPKTKIEEEDDADDVDDVDDDNNVKDVGIDNGCPHPLSTVGIL